MPPDTADFWRMKMANISRHPLIKQAYEVCVAIEEIKECSDAQTHAATLASALIESVDKYVLTAENARRLSIWFFCGNGGCVLNISKEDRDRQARRLEDLLMNPGAY